MYTTQIRRVLVASATLVALAAFAPAHAGTLTISDPSNACASWAFDGVAALTCNAATPSVPVAGAPTGCVGTATPNPVAATGGTVTLGVTGCSGAPTLGAWQSAIATPSASSLVVPTYAGTSSRTVVATIQACSTTDPTKCATVTAQTTQLAPSTGGGTVGVGGGISCSGITGKTYVVNLNYVPGTQTFETAGTFGNNDIVIAKFTTPASFAANNGWLGVAEYGGTQVKRTVALSTTACDFGSFIAKPTPSNAPMIWFASTPVAPNTTYYVNIRNANASGGASCSLGNCPILVKLQSN
jgi:hypothetical protein